MKTMDEVKEYALSLWTYKPMMQEGHPLDSDVHLVLKNGIQIHIRKE